MRRVTKAIAKKLKLHEQPNAEFDGNAFKGDTLDVFIKALGVRYGFDLSKYNEALVYYGLRPISNEEFDKAKAIKTKYYLVSEEDMKRLTLLITNMLDEYKEPPYRKQWQEFRMWIANGKFKIIKK